MKKESKISYDSLPKSVENFLLDLWTKKLRIKEPSKIEDLKKCFELANTLITIIYENEVPKFLRVEPADAGPLKVLVREYLNIEI